MNRMLRFAALGVAFSLCVLASGCRVTGLRVVIRDFATSKVLGVHVLRVDERTGMLENAGHIIFGTIKKTSQGERIPCTHVAPGGAVYGPVDAVVTRPTLYPTGIDIRVPFSNTLSAGWFRVATYNAKGNSVPSYNRMWAS